MFFRWCLKERRLVHTNPVLDVWKPSPALARERVLTDAEIIKFWKATDKIGEPFGAALKLLLLTGCRRGEVSGMQRDELSDDGTWTIPGNRTKNHRQHVVPLPPLAMELIAAVPHIEGGYVFTTTGRSAVSGWSKTKRQLDAHMPGVPDWRLHDLRRTAASGMQRLGIRTEVIERCLNHVSGSFGGVTGTYQRDTLHQEVKTALERWCQHVAGLARGKTDKVVALRGKA